MAITIKEARRRIVEYIKTIPAQDPMKKKYEIALFIFDEDTLDPDDPEFDDDGESLLNYVANEMISCGKTIQNLINWNP